jgi:general secretion pathway protein G
MKKVRKKRAMTLLEIMIVIFIIGLISSVVGYNMKGSLDKGRAFKSKEGAKQIRDLLRLEIANGYSAKIVVENPAKFIEASGMVKNASKMLKDGWGMPYRFEVKEGGEDIRVISDGLAQYESKRKGSLKDIEQIDEDED